MEAEIKQIMHDINLIKSEIHAIKENMPDKDMFLSIEESELLQESRINEKQSKLTSAKNLRKALGL
ncbi:hypothetical protein J4401_01180 [Candidatus Woesearchaeota archaeon]|nr:hypothetical protein [Candidatus Woesearchaeota archaeon]